LFKILFILCGNLSTTPRALQSAKAACANGYTVKLIGINRGLNWLKIDEQLAGSNKFEYEVVSINRKAFFTWLLTAFIHRFCFYLEKIFVKSVTIKAYASSKENYLLWQKLKRETCNYNLVIGHSAHALYPVWKYSRKHNVPFAFDVEDYHPKQVVDKVDELQAFLLKRLLPFAYYSTYASPLIGQEILNLVGLTPINNAVLINNSFPESEFIFDETQYKQKEPRVHFVWFSQNIASNRGLELIIPELKKISEKVQLHLIGNLYPDFNKNWIEPNMNFITTYPPLPQPDLNKFIGRFDIGLALELNTTDYNRQICLTNKIWAYFQAGLFILASNTPAQLKFIDAQQKSGILFKQKAPPNNEFSVHNCLNYILKNIELIRTLKRDRFEKAKNFSYENESKKLIKLWESL
jgi:hypothetical protein